MKQSALDRFWTTISQRTKESEMQFIPLGIVTCLGFALYYFIWTYVCLQKYENATLRAVAFLLGLGLVFKNYWPKALRKIAPLYWYTTLFYTFPFFFTFMMFKNNFSDVWIQNSMTGLFFLILLTNWLELLVLLVLGIVFAWISYTITTSTTYMPHNIIGFVVAYLAVLIIGAIFIHNKGKLQKEKLRTMQSLSAAVAHELRTPLASLEISTSNLKRYIPEFTELYAGTMNNSSNAGVSNKNRLAILKHSINSMIFEIRSAFTIIDMLLMNLNQITSEKNNETFSMESCVREALRCYPFQEEQRKLVHLEAKQDFSVTGNLPCMTHVFFNLIKNSLHSIAAAGKGEIFISIDQNDSHRIIAFKDTGSGIPKKILNKIFHQFFSKTEHGAGVGLTFCKTVVESLGGNIACESIAGEYALFTLSFPKIATA